MRKLLLLFLLAIPVQAQIVVDHNSVALFDQIPEQYKSYAQGARVLYVNQSVGQNVTEGLDCIATPFASAINACKRASTGFPMETWIGTWNRGNIAFRTWPDFTSGTKITCTTTQRRPECFSEYVTATQAQWDIVWPFYSYLDWQQQFQYRPYFTNSPNYVDIFDYALLETQNPVIAFVYATTSIPRVPDQGTTDFNYQMREYASANDVDVFFDVADIESHDPNGMPCTNSSGVQIICAAYTSESTGGHLGTMSTGKIRLTKAFWVLIAQIRGWQPNGPPPPPPPPPPPSDTEPPTLSPLTCTTGATFSCSTTYGDNVGVVRIENSVTAYDGSGNSRTVIATVPIP